MVLNWLLSPAVDLKNSIRLSSCLQTRQSAAAGLRLNLGKEACLHEAASSALCRTSSRCINGTNIVKVTILHAQPAPFETARQEHRVGVHERWRMIEVHVNPKPDCIQSDDTQPQQGDFVCS